MRLLRVLAAATAFAALLSQPLAAQDGRQFKDAWFWGIKGGGLLFTTPYSDNKLAPYVGADWLITRSRGGLFVSFDQAFLTDAGIFVDRDANNAQFNHRVFLNNLRRLSMAATVFPLQSPTLHPYLGIGFMFNQLASAELEGGPTSTSRYAAAVDSVQTKRSVFSPLAIAGVQMRLPRFSVFAQGQASPMQNNFFLSDPNGGRAFNLSIEAGIRYNVGSSIDKLR